MSLVDLLDAEEIDRNKWRFEARWQFIPELRYVAFLVGFSVERDQVCVNLGLLTLLWWRIGVPCV